MAVAAAAIFMGDGTGFWEGERCGGVRQWDREREAVLVLRLGIADFCASIRFRSVSDAVCRSTHGWWKWEKNDFWPPFTYSVVQLRVSLFTLSSHSTMLYFCLVLKMKTYEFDFTADESAKKMMSGPLSTDFNDVTFLHETKSCNSCSNSCASDWSVCSGKA